MRTTPLLLLATTLLGAATYSASGQSISVSQPTQSLVIPAGSKVGMELTRPVWAAKAKAGDLLYAETVSPFMVSGETAIPPGTYVEGTLTSFARPTKKSSTATFHIQFDKLIFPNGYTVVLTKPNVRALVKVKVGSTNDLLLDNGDELTMTVRTPLTLDATEVAQSIPLAQAPDPAGFVPATLCRFIPGTRGDSGSPGTPDTVIPGSPGFPGTPDTVIPGADGAPDTVIPGIPATPPTPDTAIPGSPAVAPTPPTDPIYCPDPPAVVSSVPELGPHARASRTPLALTK